MGVKDIEQKMCWEAACYEECAWDEGKAHESYNHLCGLGGSSRGVVDASE